MAAIAGRTNTVDETLLTDDQRHALADFLAVAARISQALAADNLEQFNRQIANLSGVLTPLQNELGSIPSLERADSTSYRYERVAARARPGRGPQRSSCR